MATAITAKLEIEWQPGSGIWSDITARCSTLSIDRPRADRGQASTTTLQATLDNSPDATGFCPFTPDSPAGANYPNVTRDRRIRVTAGWGGGSVDAGFGLMPFGSGPFGSVSGPTSVRFNGWTDTWSPDSSDGTLAGATVAVTASCVLSRYARRQRVSEYGEYVQAITAENDYFPLDDGDGATTFRVMSSGTGGTPGQLVLAAGGTGSASMSAPDEIMVDGTIEFSRGDVSAPSPVLLFKTRPGETFRRIGAWVKLTSDPAAANDDFASAYTADGTLVWRVVVAIVSGSVEWQILDRDGNKMSWWNTSSIRDDTWRYLGFSFNPTVLVTGILMRARGQGEQSVAGSAVWPYDPTVVDYVTVGGRMSPTRKGKQLNTLMGSVSSIHLQYGTVLLGTYSQYGTRGVLFDATMRLSRLNLYSTSIDALVGGAVASGAADDTPVQITDQPRDLLALWNELAVTTAGVLTTQPDGRRRYIAPAAARPVAPSLTLDVADDLHMPAGGWQQTLDERPTRVTGSGPPGSVTIIDTASEASTGLRLEASEVSTAGGTMDVVRAAAARVMASRAARISSVGLDGTLMGSATVTSLMALRPGDRVRFSGLPSALVGLTYIDAYASGWTESYQGDGQTAEFSFDTDPADDPPAFVFDDAAAGRFAMDEGSTITGGTCVGTTGTGTVVMTTTTPLTTAAGDYPLQLDWQGECITISGVSGASSPQTATVTARGVGPTVARPHTVGQSVQIWRTGTFS